MPTITSIFLPLHIFFISNIVVFNAVGSCISVVISLNIIPFFGKSLTFLILLLIYCSVSLFILHTFALLKAVAQKHFLSLDILGAISNMTFFIFSLFSFRTLRISCISTGLMLGLFLTPVS